MIRGWFCVLLNFLNISRKSFLFAKICLQLQFLNFYLFVLCRKMTKNAFRLILIFSIKITQCAAVLSQLLKVVYKCYCYFTANSYLFKNKHYYLVCCIGQTCFQRHESIRRLWDIVHHITLDMSYKYKY